MKSWWTDAPVVHLFPHWNWPGRVGREIDVGCYSNCDEVELWLNGRSLGRKPLERNGHLEWKVTYEPGMLLARGYQAGRETATDRVETTGASAVIRLAADRTPLRADGEDVAVIRVQVDDAQGRTVPVAGNEISFALEGPGRIIGVGNGDPSSHEPDRFVDRGGSAAAPWKRSVFNGLAQVIVQTTRQPGDITLSATSPGLAPATLKLPARPAAPRPAVTEP